MVKGNLKLEDLRIGNVIKEDGEVVQITKEYFGYLFAYFDASGRIFEPVELSPEILGACGFEKRLINNTFWEYYKECTPPKYKNEYRLIYWDWEKRLKWTPVWDGTIHNFPCTYLHELQNLYRVICGQELEVNLPVIT